MDSEKFIDKIYKETEILIDETKMLFKVSNVMKYSI